MSKGKIALTPAIDVDAVLSEIEQRYCPEQPLTIDGVKIDFCSELGSPAKINTEPIIRVYTRGQ